MEVGDSGQLFSIQSASKPVVYGLALDSRGRDDVLSKVNVEPSGEAFNSIVLDQSTNRPFNPLVNSGAIATTDLIPGASHVDRVKSLLGKLEQYVGHTLHVDHATFISERSAGHRNRTVAHLMLNFGMRSEPGGGDPRALLPAVRRARELQGPLRDGSDARQRWREPGDRGTGDPVRVPQGPAEHHARLRRVRLRRSVGVPRRPPRKELGERRRSCGGAGKVRHRRVLAPARRAGQQRPGRCDVPSAER